jgi:hypothetical protein
MLLNSLQEDEYWADHGILVANDGRGGDDQTGEGYPGLAPGIDPELLEVTALQVQPGGTVAHAGAGWLWGRASSAGLYNVVRLESHEGQPVDDRSDWDEVMETPYLSGAGTVQLALLTGGWDPDAAELSIGRPGRYRVRVSCVRDPNQPWTDEYRSVPRRTPPGFPGPGTAAPDGEDGVFDEGDVWRLQFWPAPDDLEPPRWLLRTELLTDEPLTDEPPDADLPFGHSPLLATDLISVALWTPPGTVYSVADLAARVLATLDEVRAGLTTAVHDGHLRIAGDLADDQAPLTLTALADPPPDYGEPLRLPIAAQDIGASVTFTASYGGDDADTGEDDESDADWENAGQDRVTRATVQVVRVLTASIGGPIRARAPLPYGPPPKAGIVTSNQELVVWRAGVPAVLAQVERDAGRALATPHGIVVIGSKHAVLVRPDGEQLELAANTDSRVALSGDGRHIAIATSKLGRRPKFALYLADLTDGSAQVLDLPDFFSVEAVHDGVLRYGLASEDGSGCFSWTPGAPPTPAPCLEGQFDRLSGTRLTITEPRELLAGDFLMTRRDGTEVTVKRRYDAQDSELSPGGRWLYDFWYEPLAMTVTDVSGPTPGEAVRWPLPHGCETSLVVGRRPQWEDETHLLLAAPYTDVHAIRIDAATGAIDRLRLDRQGRGEQGRSDDGAEFDVEIFIEPFRQGLAPFDVGTAEADQR